MKGNENNGLGWAGWAGLCPRIPWLAPGPAGIAVIDGAACVLGPQLELRALPTQPCASFQLSAWPLFSATLCWLP